MWEKKAFYENVAPYPSADSSQHWSTLNSEQIVLCNSYEKGDLRIVSQQIDPDLAKEISITFSYVEHCEYITTFRSRFIL